MCLAIIGLRRLNFTDAWNIQKEKNLKKGFCHF